MGGWGVWQDEGWAGVLTSSHTPAPLPGAAPSIQDEVREAEAGQLRTLERENRELRGLLQALQGQPGGPVSEAFPAGRPPRPAWWPRWA